MLSVMKSASARSLSPLRAKFGLILSDEICANVVSFSDVNCCLIFVMKLYDEIIASALIVALIVTSCNWI